MPNTGKPSQDCHLCRKRRVKCDLGRPACRRCIKYGTVCPGYRSPEELVFRPANPNKTKKRKKIGDTKEANEEDVLLSEDGIQQLVAYGNRSANVSIDESAWFPSSERAVTMGISLQEHWSSHSIPILLNVYEAIDFVYNNYRDAEPDGALVCAAHLFSRAYVTNMRFSSSVDDGAYEKINKELQRYLGRTLRLVSEALAKPGGVMRDDILATVWILTNYEILVGALPERSNASSLPLSPWHVHTQGMYGILKARGIDYLKTEKGRIAFWPAFNMVQIQSLIFSTESPPETDTWLAAFEDTIEPGERLTLRISRFIQEICSIQCRIMRALRSKDVPNASHAYRGLWQELTTADQSLADWIDEQPPFTHAIDPYMRNMQYATLVKTYHIMQLLINFLTHFPGCKIPLDELLANRRYCLQTIRGAAQGILQQLPYAIGPLSRGKDKSPRVLFDALKLIWPLVSIYVASSTVLPEQSSLALEMLLFIGREVGVRQALRAKPQINLVPDEAISPLDVDAASLELPWVQLPSSLAISLDDCVARPRTDMV